LVRFDDGTEKECSSAVLRAEKVIVSLQLPIPSNTVEAAEVQDAEEEVVDQDEEEALPPAPDVGDTEVAVEEGEEASLAPETAADLQPAGMIGQLPTEQEASLTASGKDYATVKKAAWDKLKSLLGQ
jgi:hypothetical protein